MSLLSLDSLRPLPIALAHVAANTKLGNHGRLYVLNRVFASLSVDDKLRCRAELAECRRAQRGELEAKIV